MHRFSLVERAESAAHCGVQPSHCDGFFCGAQALWCMDSVVIVHRTSCSVACRTCPDKGFNQCPLHCTVNHQGSPQTVFNMQCSMSVFLNTLHALLGLHEMILDNKGKHVHKLLPCLSAPNLPFFALIYYFS